MICISIISTNFRISLGCWPIVNKFIEIGAKSFPNKPFEELYDLDIDPYQRNNLINDIEYLDIKLELELALKDWMISQDDILINNKMPLIKPTLHPLDKNSKWNKVSSELENKLTQYDYVELHY